MEAAVEGEAVAGVRATGRVRAAATTATAFAKRAIGAAPLSPAAGPPVVATAAAVAAAVIMDSPKTAVVGHMAAAGVETSEEVEVLPRPRSLRTPRCPSAMTSALRMGARTPASTLRASRLG